MTDKKTEALKLALEALLANDLLVNGDDKKGGLAWCMDGYFAGCFDIEAVNKQTNDAITAIREALAEQCVCGEPDTPGTHRTDGLCLAEQPAQQQEPIGKWMGNAVEWTENPYKFRKGQLIYTSPPAQRTWVGLTDEEIQKEFHPLHATGLQFARAIEAKLKEKNQ